MGATSVQGRFVWYELLTADPAAAQDFYTRVIGWTITSFEGLEEPYAMWTRGEVTVGGVMALPDSATQAGAPPHWLSYIGVDDVDATYQQAVGLGATPYVAPQDIPTVGRFAVVADPQGAVFAIFTPLQGPGGPEAAPRAGDFSWRELATTDQEAAFRFYATLFGWEKKADRDMGPIGVYRVFGRGSDEWGGIVQPVEMAAPPHWRVYIKVADITRTTEAVTAHGGTVLNGPAQVPGGHWVAHCLDPQGAAFALHQGKE